MLGCASEELIQLFGIRNDSELIDGSILNFDEYQYNLHGVALLVLRMIYDERINNADDWGAVSINIDEIVSDSISWFSRCFLNRYCNS